MLYIWLKRRQALEQCSFADAILSQNYRPRGRLVLTSGQVKRLGRAKAAEVLHCQ